MSELVALKNLGITFFKGTWMRVFVVLLILNAVIYLLAQAVFPLNVFTVPGFVSPAAIVVYALWWLAVVWLLHATMALTKVWSLKRAAVLLFVWAMGLLVGVAVCPTDQSLVQASIMSFAIGSSFGWSGASVFVSLLGLW